MHREPAALPGYPSPAPLPTGIEGIDHLMNGGVPKGTSLIVGAGKTTVLISILRTVLPRGKTCALVDARDSFDPVRACVAGVDLDRLLWVRCASAEKALKAVEIIVLSGAFDLTILDLGRGKDLSHADLCWFRLRSAVEKTSGRLLVMARESISIKSAGLIIEIRMGLTRWNPPLLLGATFTAERRKPFPVHRVSIDARCIGNS